MSKKSCLFGAWVAAMIFVTSAAARGGQLSNADPAFTITIPDDFRRDTDLMATRSDFLYAFRKSEPGGLGQVIVIQKLGGTIGRERLSASQVPAGSSARLITMEWNGFDLDASEVPEQLGNVSTITYNVQVPLKSAAIQIRVMGSREKKDEVLRVAQGLLSGLTGESNWLGSAVGSFGSSANYRQVILLGTITIIVVGLLVMWIVRQKSGKPAVLMIASVIYVAGWALGPGEIRETRAATGALKMLGFLGLVAGAMDLFRFGGAKSESQPPEIPVSIPPQPDSKL